MPKNDQQHKGYNIELKTGFTIVYFMLIKKNKSDCVLIPFPELLW